MNRILYGYVSNDIEKDCAFGLAVQIFEDFNYDYIIIENIDNSINTGMSLENDIIYCNKENLKKVILNSAIKFKFIYLNFFDIRISNEIKEYILNISNIYDITFIITNLDKNIKYSFIDLDLEKINKLNIEDLKEYEEKTIKYLKESNAVNHSIEDNLFKSENEEKKFSIVFEEENDIIELLSAEGDKIEISQKDLKLLQKIIDFLEKK